jgi:uncharacterized protein
MKVLLRFFKTAYSTQKRNGKQVAERGHHCTFRRTTAALNSRGGFRIVPHMRFHQDNSNGNVIDSYDAGGVVIQDRRYTHSLLVSAELIEAWPPRRVEDLTRELLVALAGYRPGILILGTGVRQHFPPPEWLVALQREGIGIEVMKNDAAVRTFNVLLSEDRNVLLALLQSGDG